MRKTVSFILMIIGTIIMLYPQVNEWYQDYKLNKLKMSWEQHVTGKQINQEEIYRKYEKLNDIFATEINAEVNQSSEIETEDPKKEKSKEPEERETTTKPKKKKDQPIPIATLTIDKIDLELPVLEGVSVENLKYTAAHISETSPLGEIGNAAIAAHRARTKGRLFNRLNELKIGDEVIITQPDERVSVYTVYHISIVEPTDVSVLNRNKKDRILTLITCHNDGKDRLIVQAKAD